MDQNPTNPKVDFYFSQLSCWLEELLHLRALLLGTQLTEDLKWGKPCYTLNQGNVAILYAMKETCAIGFLKGSLLPDPARLLIQPGEHSQAMRMIKFTSAQQIRDMELTIRTYVDAAIQTELAGLSVEFQKSPAPEMPDALLQKLEDQPALSAAFYALTPGRQRGYALYIGQAKQRATQDARVEKCIPMIMAGKGLQDRD